MKSICIPQSVEILGQGCFSFCKRLKIIAFENESRLRRFEDYCFRRLPLRSIVIPRNVEVLGHGCFCECWKFEKVTFEKESRLKKIDDGCFQESALKSICIPRNVEVFGELCFYRCQRLRAISFESESQLTRIGRICFSGCSLESISIPRNVSSLDGSIFADCRYSSVTIDPENHHYSLDGDFLIDIKESRLVRYFGHSNDVVICPEVAILGKSCLDGCRQVESVTFSSKSQLRRLERLCFQDCSLKSICIPQNVDFIDGSAFVNCELQAIAIDPNNHYFSVDRDFLMDSSRCCLVRYLGASQDVHIWKEVVILGKSCFEGCRHVESITFSKESELKRIEELCFHHCYFKSICIPRTVEILCKSCFQCSTIAHVRFESDSRLTDIGESCFELCRAFQIMEVETYAWKDPKAFCDVFTLKDRIEQVTGRIACIRLDIGSGAFGIPVELRALPHESLSIYTSSDSIIVPLDLDIIDIDDFRSCPNLRNVLVCEDSGLREIHGFRNCLKLEVVDIRCNSIEVISESVFRHDSGCGLTRVFIVFNSEEFLRRNRRRCHNFAVRKCREGGRKQQNGEEEEEESGEQGAEEEEEEEKAESEEQGPEEEDNDYDF
jgi:hypothetical protein